MLDATRAPNLHAPIEILSMRIMLTLVVMKWGGILLATFTFRTWPFVLTDARLLRTPEGEHIASLNTGNRLGRVTIQDGKFSAALADVALAEFEAKTAHLRPAVSASREGFVSTENPP